MSLHRSRLAVILGLALFTTAPAARAQPEAVAVPDSVTPERVVAGSELYNDGSCAACHAVGGRGIGRRAPDLSDIEWLHSEGDFDGIFETIFWGVPKDRMKAVTPRPFEMHPRGGMTIDREQMKALAAYVWTVAHPDTHPFVAEQARALVQRLGSEVAVHEGDEVTALYHTVLLREPTGDELASAEAFLHRASAEKPDGSSGRLTRLEQLAQTLMVSNEAVFVD